LLQEYKLIDIAPDQQPDATEDIYSIYIQARKVSGDFESIGDEEYILQCNFEPFVQDLSSAVGLADK
jgi:hypothetical protein